MDRNKFKKTIIVAIFVSAASQVRFNFLTEGFIVAMSVMVMAIFIYCYEDLSAMYIAFCSGIFAVLFRLMITLMQNGHFEQTSLLVLPDLAFFFTYGIVFTFIYRCIVKKPKSIRNFPVVIFACDLCSNLAEMTARCIVTDHLIFTVTIVTYLVAIAFFRTLLIQMVLIAIESYSSFLVNKEHDEEYKKLLTQASIFESELHLMEKNTEEIEFVMKQAYDLHSIMDGANAPDKWKKSALDIAKNAHEVKGDYVSVISVLKDTYVGGLGDRGMSIGDIVALERANTLSLIRKHNQSIDISSRVRADFSVKESFKMMSIIRNLLVNASEAIGDSVGKITISVTAVKDKKSGEPEDYVIKVSDNGPGIDNDNINDIFLTGYSTKFDPDTGNIQRGLGLGVVKEYVETYFNGKIDVESSVGIGTDVVITMPAAVFEEKTNEVLHS